MPVSMQTPHPALRFGKNKHRQVLIVHPHEYWRTDHTRLINCMAAAEGDTVSFTYATNTNDAIYSVNTADEEGRPFDIALIDQLLPEEKRGYKMIRGNVLVEEALAEKSPETPIITSGKCRVDEDELRKKLFTPYNPEAIARREGRSEASKRELVLNA